LGERCIRDFALLESFHITTAMSMKGWQLSNSLETSFIKLLEGRITQLPEHTNSYTNKKNSQAELWESGPSLQRLESLDQNDLFLGKKERDIQWARCRLAEYSPLEPSDIWKDSNFLSPFEITCETNVLAFVETRYLQRAVCAGLFLCCEAMEKYAPERCPGRETAYWHDSSTTGTSGRPDRILKYCKALLGSIGDVGDDKERHRIGCVVEGKTAQVCASVTAGREERVNVLEMLSEYAGNWDEEEEGNFHAKWLGAEKTWEVKAKEFLLQVNLSSKIII
jgi:hypothetical protein